LSLANGWRLPAPIVDFHHRVTAHAGRTYFKKIAFNQGYFFILSFEIKYFIEYLNYLRLKYLQQILKSQTWL